MSHPFSLVHIEECTSTNQSVREYPPFTALCAQSQTQGRGRRGNVWASPKGGGLYFSVFLPQKPSSFLPLLTGLAVVLALKKMGAQHLFLKWPNDIFLNEKKLGGILVEQEGQHSVVGVGLNFKTPILEKSDYPLANLSEAFAPNNLPDSHFLLNGILEALSAQLEKPFLPQEWEEHALWLGKIVQLSTENGVFEGRFLKINTDGAILLDGFPQAFFSGSLRCPSFV